MKNNQSTTMFLRPSSLPACVMGSDIISNYLRARDGDAQYKISRERVRLEGEEYMRKMGLPSDVELIQEHHVDRETAEFAMEAVRKTIMANTDGSDEVVILKEDTFLLKKNGQPFSLRQFLVCGVTRSSRRGAFFI